MLCTVLAPLIGIPGLATLGKGAGEHWARKTGRTGARPRKLREGGGMQTALAAGSTDCLQNFPAPGLPVKTWDKI